MKLVVRGAQPRLQHMRVNLRRRQVGVAEHHLDHPQVRAALEQVRRERVPQDVRAEVARDAGLAAPYPLSTFQKPTRDSGPPSRALTNSQRRRLLAQQRRAGRRACSGAPSRRPRARAAPCAACPPCRCTSGIPRRGSDRRLAAARAPTREGRWRRAPRSAPCRAVRAASRCPAARAAGRLPRARETSAAPAQARGGCRSSAGLLSCFCSSGDEPIEPAHAGHRTRDRSRRQARRHQLPDKRFEIRPLERLTGRARVPRRTRRAVARSRA